MGIEPGQEAVDRLARFCASCTEVEWKKFKKAEPQQARHFAAQARSLLVELQPMMEAEEGENNGD